MLVVGIVDERGNATDGLCLVQSAMTTVVPLSSDCHSAADPMFTGPLMMERAIVR